MRKYTTQSPVPSGDSNARVLLRIAYLPLCLLFTLFASCSGGNADCSPGQVSCECLPTGGCADGLSCQAGVCAAPTCSAGTEGCECLNDSCGVTTAQEPLSCTNGICQLTSCPAGDVGCACIHGSGCSPGAACVDGLCKSQECIPGTEGCDCLAGGCRVGLSCVQNVCLDQAGRIGGACFSDGTCSQNARCDSGLYPASCVYCELGSIGCQCDGNSCLPGFLCVNGYCSGDPEIQTRTVPTNPVCHTPCNDDVTLGDGTVLTCDSDGLVEGCLDGRICNAGECVAPGEERRVCWSDSICPEFMQCIRGYCYSTCESDVDCENGEGCHLKTCRPHCTTNSNDCPANMVCDAPDNEAGFCMPRSSEVGEEVQFPQGALRVGTTNLRFSNVDTEREVRLINTGDEAIRVVVSKVDHTLVTATGSKETKTISDEAACNSFNCPLWWMEIGVTGSITQGTSTEVLVPARCEENLNCPRVAVRIRGNGVDAVRWRGSLRFESVMGTDLVTLSYTARPEGQWAGKIVYFANFDDVGIDSFVDENGIRRVGWLDRDRAHIDAVGPTDTSVRNGLIRRWGAFRTVGLTGGWSEMAAILSATETEQWRWPSLMESCPDGSACYLFSNGAVGGIPKTYVNSVEDEPIPDGSSILPMAFNLYAPYADQPNVLEGRVVSNTALHYPGNPFVELRFEGDPSDQDSCTRRSGHCLNFLQTASSDEEIDGLFLELGVGGRYLVEASQSCPSGFVKEERPWLVPGFDDMSSVANGFRRRAWCLDHRLPSYEDSDDPVVQIENKSLARGNPVPYGQVIRRKIKLLDGAMIDQTRIFILFRESYPSFLGEGDLVSYGYMLLERRPVQIDRADEDNDMVPDEYEGAKWNTPLEGGAPSIGVQCTPEIVEALNLGGPITRQNADMAISKLISGRAGATIPLPSGTVDGCGNTTAEEVHYLCEETGLFDGGSDNVACWGQSGYANDDGCSMVNGVCNDGLAGSENRACAAGWDATDCGNRYRDSRIACPLESNVVFFTAPANQHLTIVEHDCQDTGTCGSTLSDWSRSGAVIIQVNPDWNCAEGRATCDSDALDRRAGKVFFPAQTTAVSFPSIRATIADAFRYRSRFSNREGTGLGFTPAICQSLDSPVPYCYSPADIQEVRDRTDCLLSIYEAYHSDPNLPPSAQNTVLYDYLKENFAESPASATEPSRTGFEKLYSELLIMMGDQAYTNAFESRFDLAGIGTAGFQGAEFEDNGLSLSGIAGYEMFTLHQAVQYYGMALDRFYGLASVLSGALGTGSTVSSRQNFLSAETVTLYFDRLIRASTQKSRAWAEIARRYQAFNKPNLARRVAARAYNATYLESIAITNTIKNINRVARIEVDEQLKVALRTAQRSYSMALLDLANVYQSITDDVNILGFDPSYVPFPALGTGGANIDINAFERIYQFAQSKLESARRREEVALAQTREFDTDSASFQAELTRVARTYEQQLSEICGLFTGTNGEVYPAIEQYAFRSDQYALYGDPCGYVGNGAIHQAIVNVDVARIEMARVMAEMDNVRERIQIQKTKVGNVCRIQNALADLRFETAQRTFELDELIIRADEVKENAARILEGATSIAQTSVCGGTDCPASITAANVIFAATAVNSVVAVAQQEVARELRKDKAELERSTALSEGLAQCDIGRAELVGEVKSMLLSLNELELTLIAAQLRTALAISEGAKLRQQAQRLQLEMEEAVELAVNVQAARNDPNVRIYRNDAVINAELSFQDALREAYRLTLVYEYYTSQSYAARDQLFLSRMVALGDYNLENYVADLRNAFLEFEEQFGNPDLRVIQVSLMDDIFLTPRVGEDGQSLGDEARYALLRQRLSDPKYLNRDGYISIPFATRLDVLSPVTRNHKIFYIEANIEGSGLGDFEGRIYLRQRGTSTVNNIGGGESFFRFPQRTAVLNPAFNAVRPRELSDPNEIFRSYRLRDLPLVNDHWEMIVNQRDEEANLDINLNGITDIKLYIYYTDFTVY